MCEMATRSASAARILPMEMTATTPGRFPEKAFPEHITAKPEGRIHGAQ